MSERRPWIPSELLLAFRLYCRLPFGQLHQHNAEIIALSDAIRRTPSAVAMKACNFASLDPHHHERGVVGLGNVSRADRTLWERFIESPTIVAIEVEAAYEDLLQRMADQERTNQQQHNGEPFDASIESILSSIGETERETVTRVRRVQGFFRSSVLASYDEKCALSELGISSLLNASHIVPWNQDENRRADPRNGICLNALYDRAFDRGLITFDESLNVFVSPALRSDDPPALHRDHLLGLEGRKLRRPRRFDPDPAALAWHREHVFRETA